jgi:4'-phosphopantetheinyl transferase
MLNPGEIHVWRVNLDKIKTPTPTAGEAARAARFATSTLRRRYLSAHGALRDILARFTDARLDFALQEKGKPYLPHVPDLQFNLSHSHQIALVAVAYRVPVGVDVERLRPLAEHAAIADRFFPPGEPGTVDAPDFFRRWTRFEAILKAQGLGLYGAGSTLEGEWTVQELDAGPGFAAAVAAPGTGHTVVIHSYGENEE